LEAAYPECDLVVTHGGPGVIAGALAAQKPVLLLPTQNEQTMLARRIAQQGYGDFLPFDAPGSQIHKAIENLLGDTLSRAAIEHYGVRYRERGSMDNRISDLVAKILNAVARIS